MSRHNSTASLQGSARVPAAGRSRVKRHLNRCETSGKVRFRDKREALEAVHQARNRRQIALADGSETSRQERRAYSCASCHGWHITSQESWGGRTPAAPDADNDMTKVRVDRVSGPRRVFLASRRHHPEPSKLHGAPSVNALPHTDELIHEASLQDISNHFAGSTL